MSECLHECGSIFVYTCVKLHLCVCQCVVKDRVISYHNDCVTDNS